MSLNRSEQRVFDYMQGHPDERHFWVGKVQSVWSRSGDDAAAVAQLESELWLYYKERSAVVPVFQEAARAEGLQRTSIAAAAVGRATAQEEVGHDGERLILCGRKEQSATGSDALVKTMKNSAATTGTLLGLCFLSGTQFRVSPPPSGGELG
jgi:hypothetical protein